MCQKGGIIQLENVLKQGETFLIKNLRKTALKKVFEVRLSTYRIQASIGCLDPHEQGLRGKRMWPVI